MANKKGMVTKMKLLVTGCAGFIGSNFVRYMLTKHPDYQITNLDKLTYAGNPDNLKDVESNSNYRFIKGDICDPAIVDNLAAQSDMIINFAAETHVDRSILYAGDFIQTDVFGTYILLESIKKHKLQRYIQISTDEVYGSIDSGSFDEQSTLRPNSPYSASKTAGDLLVRSYIATYNTPCIIVRASNNFGPYQYPEKVIPLFITNAIENNPLPLYGDGLNVRDWLYVIDNCSAIDTVLHKGKTGEIYNVSASNETTNIDLTKKILTLLGKPESLIKPVTDRPGHDRRYSVNSTKLRNQLGWKPIHDFDTALKQTVDWYVNNKDWWMKIKHKSEEYKEYYKQQYKA
jgi:dTDP-glucose 4,6-dehydratase